MKKTINRILITPTPIYRKVRGSVSEIETKYKYLLHFVAFFHVASLISTEVDNRKVGVDNKKALELTNSAVFHRGRQ